MKQSRTNRRSIRRRVLVLGFATAGLSPFALQSAHAASANWSAAPTNGMWEATGSENNWTTGVATFPGSTAGIMNSTDVATFTGTSTAIIVALNSTAGNLLPLNIGSIAFTGANKSSYTIGSTSGNVLWLSATNANAGATTLQTFISGGGSTGTGGTETINSPVVLQPPSNTTAGFYTFQNNSTGTAGPLDNLVFNGSITPGTTSAAVTLTLRGGNTNVGNALNGILSNGGAAGGLALQKSDAGTWTLSGANTFTGPIAIQNGTLRFTGSYNGGGTVTFAGSTAGTLLINTAGTVQVGDIHLDQANSLVNVTAGTLIAGSISENAASASRQVTLNGGVLRLTADYGAIPGALNLNGGTLANGKSGNATLTIDSWLTNTPTIHNINVQAGGGTFDTTNGNITSLAPLNGGTGTVNITGGGVLKAGATITGVMSVQGASTWDTNGLASSVAGLSGSGSVTNSGAAATLTSNLAGTQTFTGSIGGGANISFIKSGAGTQVLSGTQSYTGTTSTNAGALIITGALTTSDLTVNGGSLGGTGNGVSTGALGNVLLTAGGSLIPGASAADGSVGTMVIANLDANNGSTRFDLVSPGASDKINAGAATFSASNTFTLVGVPASGTYTLIQSTSALAGAQPTLVTPTGTRATYTPHYGDVDPNQFQLIVAGTPKSLTWTGANGTGWDVNATTNWTDGAIDEKFFNLDSVTFDNSGANKGITLNTTVQPNSVAFNNGGPGNDYTISGTGGIAGLATTLTKSGSGKVTLAANNTYGGGTTISGGTLQIGNGGTVGSLGSGTVTNNAALVFNRSDTNTLSVAVNGTGSLQQSGAGTLVITSSNNYSGPTTIDTGTTIQLGDGGTTGNFGSTSGVTDNGTLIYNRSNAHTLTAVISGSGSLVVNSGTLSLAANNTYTGTTTINAGGTLQIGNGGTSGSPGTGPISNSGTLSFNRSDTIAPASFSGSGAIQQDGTGTLLFSGPSSFTGPLNINNGTVAGLHANAFGSTPNITIAANGTLSLRNDASTTFARVSDSTPYSIIVSASGATINVDQATVAGTAPKTMTIGTITATQTAPAFTLNFTGANNTSLSVGAINGPPATQGFATTTINNNNLSGTTTIASYTGNNTVGNENVNIVSIGDTTFTGGISDPPSAWPLGITKNGNGKLTLLGASTYSNGTVIAAGIVAIGDDSALGIFDVNLNAPDAVGVLQSTNSTTRTLANNIVNSSTNFTFGGTGNLVFNGNWNKGQFFKNLIVQCPMITINGVVSGGGPALANQGFSKDGTGTLVLAGTNIYNGDTVVRQGTLTVAPTGSLGVNTFGLEVSNNNTTGPGTATVLNLSTASDTTVGNLSGVISTPTSGTNTATINTGGSGLNFIVNQTTALTAPANIAGAGNFVLGSLSTNTLTLTGNLTYSGTTTVSAGTLRLQTNLTSSSAVTISDGATMQLASNGSSMRVIKTPSLTVAPTAKLDITDNKLITQSAVGTWNGASYDGITGLVASGRNGNAWNGNGIVTTQSAAQNSNYTSIGVARASDVRPATATATDLWGGQTITGSDTLVMYTYGGDANLDGKLNIDDYVKIDQGISANLTGWSNGDFNYDGKVNIDDYSSVIDSNIGIQGGTFPTTTGLGSPLGVSAVPEPAGLSLVAASALALLARVGRRKRHSA